MTNLQKILLKFIELQGKALTTNEVVWLENFVQYLEDKQNEKRTN